MILLMGFFYITGYNRNAAALILIFWWIILGIWIVTGYYRRKKYFDRAEHILENVDQRYLLGELLPASPYLEDRIYRELIRRSNKSVIERIRMLEDEQNDYRCFDLMHPAFDIIPIIILFIFKHTDPFDHRFIRSSDQLPVDPIFQIW